MKQCILFLSALGFLMGSLAMTQAAAPANDNFANRIALSGAVVTTSGNTVEATAEAGEPIHYGLSQNNGGHSVWWSWTAPLSGQATITTAGSTYNTILAIYTGTAVNALSLIATNDDDTVLSASTSRVAFNAAAGTTYQIAVDGFGAFPNGATGSVTLNISALTASPITLISTGSVWKYLDDGSDPGTAWRAVIYNDAGWSNGVGQLGFGDNDEATLIRSNRVDNSRIISYYFRKAFVLTNASAFVDLSVHLLRDDGAVVYLNSNEVFRSNMPGGVITNLTLATSSALPEDESTKYYSNSIAPALLLNGTNVIAVEVHQNAATSSDITFDLALHGLTAASNAPPTVTLTFPSVSSTSAAPASFTLSANATDPDGSVARVDFYTNSAIVGTDFSAPFSFAWSNAVAGTYAIRAVAIDAFGATGTSAPVSLVVTGNVPPFAAISSPSEGTTFSAPASITINATAGDTDGTVTNVEFYQGTTRIGQDNSNPFAFTTNGVPIGSYAFRVVATDNSGARGTSAVVNVTVNPNTPPAISLTNPLNNATFVAPANITLAANATDLEAPVASVAFYTNNVLLGTDSTSPFTFDWSGVTTGAYALRAIATDAGGLTATSSVVNITVQAGGTVTVLTNFLVSSNSAGWKYLDNNVDQGTAWQARLFNDTTWSNGVAQLGFGDGDEATIVSSNQQVTTYFRKSFVLNNASTYTNLQLWLLRDDGGAVYLNGTEIFRTTNMPPGFTFSTLTVGGAPPDNAVDITNVNAGLPLLINGTNVIAVEIHQSSLTSSDISMDLQLVGVSVITTGSNLPPSAVINSPVNNASFNPPPATIVIDAGASDPDDTVAKVEFYSNNVKIGEDLTAPYSFTYSGVGNGNYALAAVALDTFGARGTSATVNVTVTGVANQPPNVALTNPPSGTFNAPTNLLLQASANDPDGSVAKVEFFRSGVKLGEDTTAPFALDWTNALVGTFAMTAVATDNGGLTATSVPVSMTFTGAAPSLIFPMGSVWKYRDTGENLGTAWVAPGFDDTAWASGPGQLGYSSNPPENDEATFLSYGPDANNKYITTYFRRAFTVANPGAYSALSATYLRDDGIIGYLNGVEVFRNNMPAGTVNYQTLSSATASDDGTNLFTNTIVSTLLVPGTNVFAVEIHQSSLTSSDISFDLSLIGNTGAIVNNPPSVALSSPANNATFTEPANITINATAGDSDGTVTNVAFYVNGVKLADDPTAPYSVNWNNVPLGNYALTAVATDNFGATNQSTTVNVFVTGSTAPELATRTPAPGTVNALTQIAVQFTEPVDGVDAADLLINGTPASSVTGSNANYTFTFPQPMDGVVAVRFATSAGITDREAPPKNFDPTTTNAAWTYTLADNIPPTVIAISPQPGATVKALSEIQVTFSEAVGGVNAADLRINGAGATTLNGSGAGPYRFGFAQPTNSAITVAWTNTHGIRDFAAVPNNFAGGALASYTLNTNLVETNLVISEIMYHPFHNQAAFAPEPVLEEYVELLNRGGAAVNLAGWSISGGVSYTFSNITLNAGAYLVVAANRQVFTNKYTWVTNVVGNFTGRLGNSDDSVHLDSPLGDRVDSVHYYDEGDWALRRFVLSENSSELNWDWTTPADGGGSSLELINAALPNQYGQNWSASVTNTGSPGRANSVATNNVAPFILNAAHAPAIPSSTNAITITARLLDEQTAGVTGTLFWRIASVVSSNLLGAFNSTNMLDNGLNGDGLAGDGVFGATLPAQPNQTIIEYYVQASDAGGRTRTWPAPTEANGTQGANALLQVDDDIYPGPQPIFRVIMTGPENQRLADLNRSNPNANVQMNAAFISTDAVQTQVRQLLNVRHRGAGSRGAQPPNLRAHFPRDQRWNNVASINLNTRFTYSQVPGSMITRKAGLTSEEAVAVQVRRSGTNSAVGGDPMYGSYVWLEGRDSDWVANHYPNDAQGNLYTATRPSGGLTLLGSYAPANMQSSGYQKDSNQSENDYSDVADLIQVLNNTPDAQYAAAVRQRANVAQWVKDIAVLSLVGYGETALWADGAPDDYTLFRGNNDTRFQIVPHDHDTDFGKGDSPRPTTDSVFRAADGSAVVSRFLRHPEFAPLYYLELQHQLDTTFQPAEINRIFDQAYSGWPVAAQTIFDVKNWMTNRYFNVRAQIPLTLTINHTLPIVSGYPQTTTGTLTLSGVANAITTRAVRVNGQAATWTAWQAAWTLSALAVPPGISRITVQSLDAAGTVLDERTLDVWYDDGTTANVSGAIAGNQTLTASGGPYIVTANVTIGNGATLTLQPGTTLYLNSGVTINVSGTGRLLAEGTEAQRIRFTRPPGSATTWGSLDLINASLESRISYADIEACGGTTIGGHNAMLHVNNSRLFMDHCVFTNAPAVEYISFDNSSFIVQNSVFPTYPYATSAPEMLHGVNGIPANGYGIFRDNYFGHTWGFNDTIDFTGGQRPAAILQIINNVFDGAGDDHLDLDSTDAWIEGNIFLHAHRDTNRTDTALDTASAISGGVDVAGQFSEWTIINNLFYDVDHALMNKGGSAPGAGRFIFINNTLVHVNKENGAGLPTDIAAFNFTDDNVPLPDPAYGAGGYVAGNIIWDSPALVANYNPSNHTVIFENNLLPLAWSGPGSNNVVADPLLNLSLITDPRTADWRTVKAALTPRAGSPALGSGVGGFDRGGMNPRGLLVWGEPSGFTPLTTATLRVASGGTFNWGTNPPVPPYAWGYTHYKWKLDNGPWSAETSITSNSTINLSGLSDGPHTVYVVGKNDAGYYQDDTLVYPATAGIAGRSTASRTWYVNALKSQVRLSEVLARNDSAVPVGANFPDLIELHNPGTGTVSLAGMGLSDEADNPFKFTFPPGAALAGGQFLVLFADSDVSPPGFHLGFSLKGDGDEVFLTASNGMTLDSVVFGPQLADRSIGRGADGVWRLNQPTFGAANVAIPTGDPRLLKINEWLASGLSPYPDDFIELFNPGSTPIDLGPLFLTDNPIGAPRLHDVAPLSFIPAGGYLVYIADGNAGASPLHVNFKLRSEQGLIGLMAADGSVIDCVIYGPQTTDVSMGRQPNGAATYGFFSPPTPGAPNPSVIGVNQSVVINEVLAWNINKKAPDGSTPDWVELYNPTGTNFSLTDLSLSDNPLEPRKYVFPPGLGVVVPALGYFSLRLDPDIPTGPTNAGFGLKSSGQALYLYDKLANGGGQLSVVSFGVQAADFSIGRVPGGSSNWVLCVESIGFANTAVVLGDPANLKVNEWMANPSSGDDWFEIFNPNAQPVALGGLHLSDRIDTALNRMKHRIAPLSFIGVAGWAYQRFEADGNTANGPEHVNFSLAAGGEQLGVSSAAGALINGVQFFAQAVGVSQGRLPDGGAVITNFPGTASPGDPNYLLLTNVVINEALTHSDPPFEDAIEVRNLSGASVNIGGWFISDAKHQLSKYRIPNGTILPANGFKVFYEAQFNDTNSAFAFALSSAKGDEIYLGQASSNGALSGYRAQASFGAGENSVSFGRYVTSVGESHFVAMSARTFGQDFPDTVEQFRLGTGLPNAYPKVGPIVVSEIMYHPPDINGTNDDTIHEFIELRNLSASAVPLYHPLFTSNSWKLKDAVSFTFAQGTSIPGFGYLLVVSFNPTNLFQLAEFRSYYGLSPAATIVGPWNGKLDNGGESVEIYKPDAPQPDGDVPQILVERVKYSDALPWPTNRVDGGGFSLQRINPDEYGNDPINWTAAAPTPGPAAGADSDGDGMPDAWELQYGLNVGVNDANGDLDGDGVSNLNEYLSGTAPNDPNSFLKLTIVGTGPVTLQFNAAANLGYSILYKNTLTNAMWTTLTNVAAGVARPVQIIDPTATGATRFYRLRTP